MHSSCDSNKHPNRGAAHNQHQNNESIFSNQHRKLRHYSYLTLALNCAAPVAKTLLDLLQQLTPAAIEEPQAYREKTSIQVDYVLNATLESYGFGIKSNTKCAAGHSGSVQ